MKPRFMSIHGVANDQSAKRSQRSDTEAGGDAGRVHGPDWPVRLWRSCLPRGAGPAVVRYPRVGPRSVCIQASAYRIGQSLDTRALAVKGLKERPDVLDRPIIQPIIIAGLVRSGTTALHLLLSLDPQFQGPEHWLTVYPMPRPPRDRWADIPAYISQKATLDAFLAASPEAADDHMMTAEGIEESLFILGSSFSSNMWPSMWNVPTYDRWYRGRDDSDSYRWLADVLRLIGAGDDRRWLLKNPTDLFSLQEVLSIFPDAKVIQTHRDPVDSMPSVSNLIFSARRAFCGRQGRPGGCWPTRGGGLGAGAGKGASGTGDQ
jgi:hypothetical protein